MMRLVILESPYAGDDVTANVMYAKRCLGDCLARDEAPIASHILLAASGVLDDAVPAWRMLGLRAGWAWYRVADAAVVYVDRGVSGGMLTGMQHAFMAIKPVEFRSLFGDQPAIERHRDNLKRWIDAQKIDLN